MTTPPDETALRPLALTSISASLNILTSSLMDQGLDVTNDAIWKPAKRAFLEALIREAQLELAEGFPAVPPIKAIAPIRHNHAHTHGSGEYALTHLHTHMHSRGSESHDTTEHNTPT